MEKGGKEATLLTTKHRLIETLVLSLNLRFRLIIGDGKTEHGDKEAKPSEIIENSNNKVYHPTSASTWRIQEMKQMEPPESVSENARH